MKKLQPIFLSLLSGLLFFLAWPTISFTAAVFFAFIPLLLIEQMGFSRLKFFGLIYLAMFVWNLSATWWIVNSTFLGAALAILVNSMLMCIPLMGFRYMNKRFGAFMGYASFIVFWMSFEYLHLQDWGLSWPWLTTGNAFASRTEWVQWYEFTGTSGGTLWVLLVNVFLYVFFLKPNTEQTTQKVRLLNISGIVAAIMLPIILSFIISRSLTNPPSGGRGASYNIIVVQPNIDPYEKVATGSFDAQLQKLIRLSESKIDSTTQLLIWPETALYSANGFDEASLKTNFFLTPLFSFLQKHPHLQLFTGIESYRVFNKKVSSVARPIDGASDFYEVYNGSVLLDSSGAKQFYHKSMLVPGVETLPRFLRFLAPVFEKFGGTEGGYASQAERTPIITQNNIIIAPAICYESIYGEYMSQYIQNKANLIAIITNDGWWGNTQGHKHHQLYARLRAIETRTWVARSANTGISCFIDPKGNLLQSQPWRTEAAIKQSISLTTEKTFYIRYGDLLSKFSLALTAFFIAFAVFKRFSKK
ncbi:MAG: apolipoprotein N-acyltransferase [Chitinophagaceae bacterium]|nr:apolipoprotein N-acyltransferase [Chitinophagaceae bacterium]